jgi:hypothetical protein
MRNMQQKHSSWLMGTAVVLVSGLLMTACQPAAQPAAAAQTQAQGQTQTQGFGNGQRPNFQMTAAPELPTDQPALRGALVSLNGTTLTVQEGGFGFGGGGNFGANNGTPRAPQNGTPRPRPTAGPAVQVDASGAKVYEDTTFANLNGQPPSGTVQQTVVASSVDKIPANARVTIWGTLNGTSATATVIVFTQPRGNGAPQGQTN